MKIENKLVETAAELINLELSEIELEAFAKELESVYSFAEKINELDTDEVSPSFFPIPVFDMFSE